MLIARTGYSGEDGFEVYIPSDEATTVKMWNALMEAGAEFGIRPCGLGARNTLRLEAGMSLYGHEISEEINVFEAGLTRWLKMDKDSFIGRDALLAVQAEGGPKRKIVGLEMVERGIGRDGYFVLSSTGESIGTITSGSPAPFLKTNIAMALVPTAVAESGADVVVECRGNRVRAKQVPLPFYGRAEKQCVRDKKVEYQRQKWVPHSCRVFCDKGGKARTLTVDRICSTMRVPLVPRTWGPGRAQISISFVSGRHDFSRGRKGRSNISGL